MPAYACGTNSKLNLPHTELIAKRALSLPMYPELTESDQDKVIKTLKEFFKS